ncbi:MAG: helix-turn-helix transcriptional regulator [Victivallales bacterium]|nr:helix-turn-helix transcriptional regulator [Victivallales bacterium]
MDTMQSKQIADRVRELRDVMDMTQEEVASRLNLSLAEYQDYEANRKVIPISTLNALAEILGTDFTVLLTGEAPRMAQYTLVRKGQGVHVERYPGYSFQSLAYNFRNRTMEPMLVYLEPHEDENGQPALVTHGGQEFNLVVEGTVKVVIGTHEFVLNEGDSIYFDPSIPHGQRAVGGPVKFVTIINN